MVRHVMYGDTERLTGKISVKDGEPIVDLGDVLDSFSKQ